MPFFSGCINETKKGRGSLHCLVGRILTQPTCCCKHEPKSWMVIWRECSGVGILSFGPSLLPSQALDALADEYVKQHRSGHIRQVRPWPREQTRNGLCIGATINRLSRRFSGLCDSFHPTERVLGLAEDFVKTAISSSLLPELANQSSHCTPGFPPVTERPVCPGLLFQRNHGFIMASCGQRNSNPASSAYFLSRSSLSPIW
jgi:hypothetical protein